MTRTKKAKKGAAVVGPFVMHTKVMIMSPAWRVLSQAGRRALDRIEVEMMNHGGELASNGSLIVTWDDFEAYGVHRESIKPALAEIEALGFVELTVEGRGGNAAHRKANQFRLTYFKFKENSTIRYEPTNEWRRLHTMEEAELIARKARGKTPKKRRQKKTFPSTGIRTAPGVDSVLQPPHSEVRNPYYSPVLESVLPIIFSMHNPDAGAAAVAADATEAVAEPRHADHGYTSPDGTLHFSASEIAKLEADAFLVQRVFKYVVDMVERPWLPGKPPAYRKQAICEAVMKWHNERLSKTASKPLDRLKIPLEDTDEYKREVARHEEYAENMRQQQLAREARHRANGGTRHEEENPDVE